MNGGDDDLGAVPVVAVLFIDNRLEIRRKQCSENLMRLVFQFQPVDQEEHTAGISGAQEKLDDGRSGERLSGACRHLKQKTVSSGLYRPLQRMDRSELIGTQKAQIVGLNEAGALGFILPRSFRGIMRPVGESDVIFANLFRDQALRVGRDLSIVGYGGRRREGGDDIGVAAIQIPEVMQIAVRQDDEAAILGAGVFAGLLLADERVFVLRLST